MKISNGNRFVNKDLRNVKNSIACHRFDSSKVISPNEMKGVSDL